MNKDADNEDELLDEEEPATAKQISYIKRLGGNPREGLTKLEASSEIEELLFARDTAIHEVANHYEREHDIDLPENALKEVYAKTGPRRKGESKTDYIKRFASHMEIRGASKSKGSCLVLVVSVLTITSVAAFSALCMLWAGE
jgi:hypothetical protein